MRQVMLTSGYELPTGTGPNPTQLRTMRTAKQPGNMLEFFATLNALMEYILFNGI